jgi:hypothetical protein
MATNYTTLLLIPHSDKSVNHKKPCVLITDSTDIYSYEDDNWEYYDSKYYQDFKNLQNLVSKSNCCLVPERVWDESRYLDLILRENFDSKILKKSHRSEFLFKVTKEFLDDWEMFMRYPLYDDVSYENLINIIFRAEKANKSVWLLVS